MVAEDIAIPLASTAAGGITVLWISKLLITNWLKRYDKAMDEITALGKDMAVSLHRLATIEKDLNGLGNLIRRNVCGNTSP